MKSILLSIKPEWLVKILNREKTIEVRKKFPKDYVGWVYLYCSKDNKNKLYKSPTDNKYWLGDDKYLTGLNGKVVARFWCDKVDEIGNCSIDVSFTHYTGDIYSEKEVCEGACLSWQELGNYLKGGDGYAIHISKLEIFDEPRKLGEFHTVNKYGIPQYQFGKGTCDYKKLTKAPQNYCYVEGE